MSSEKSFAKPIVCLIDLVWGPRGRRGKSSWNTIPMWLPRSWLPDIMSSEKTFPGDMSPKKPQNVVGESDECCSVYLCISKLDASTEDFKNQRTFWFLDGREKHDGSLTGDIVVVSSPAVDEHVVAAGNTKDVNVGQTPTIVTVDPNLGAKKEWGLSPKAKVRVLHTAQLDVTNPDVNLLKEDIGNVLVWVKLHGVYIMAFSEDGLSAIATKLGTPLMLDSYISDMYMQSWGRSSYARAMIELQADVCACYKVFGHVYDECPKNIGSGVAKNLKNPSKLLEKDAKFRKEVSNLNPFEVLNSIENDVDLGINEETLNLASKEASFNEFSFWNVRSSCTSSTPIVEIFDKLERLITDEKLTLVDDEGKPIENIDYSGDHDIDDDVEPVDNEMTSFLASMRVGYGTDRLLEQWNKTYENADYDYNPYNDDIYEG
nr:hypothetical protein [Tanacetum cinerariifolium]